MYWRNPFRPMATAKQLVEYIVLDIETLGPASQKHSLAEVQVRCCTSCTYAAAASQGSRLCGRGARPGVPAAACFWANLTACRSAQLQA